MEKGGLQLEFFDQYGNPQFNNMAKDISKEVSSSLSDSGENIKSKNETIVPDIRRLSIDVKNEKLQENIYSHFKKYPKSKGDRATIFQKITTHIRSKQTNFSKKDLVKMVRYIVKHIQENPKRNKAGMMPTIDALYVKSKETERGNYRNQKICENNKKRIEKIAEVIMCNYVDFARIFAEKDKMNNNIDVKGDQEAGKNGERTRRDDIRSDYGW